MVRSYNIYFYQVYISQLQKKHVKKLILFNPTIKLAMKKIFTILFIFMTFMAFSQEDGSETFNEIRDAYKPTIPAGFSVNTGQTSDNRFIYRFTYDENGSELNRLIYNLSPGSKEFSEMDIALGGERYTWNEREALYIDGSETGMSVLIIILKKNVGMFSITHRDFKTFKHEQRRSGAIIFKNFNG